MPYTNEQTRTRTKPVNIKKVWVVFTNHDEHGQYDEVNDLLGVYEYKTDADREAQGQGWYGGEGTVEERIAIRCDGKWFLTQNPVPVKLNKKHGDNRKALRKSALRKLNAREKEVLGLLEEE